jgi:benzoyl-CoA reductase/2-hydroxyglutaryl-CoA dehydratase subunit BcrC/BadD/HgdB
MEVILTSPWLPAEWIKAYGHEPRGVWFHPGFGSQKLRLGAGVCPFAQRVLSFADEQKESAFVFSTHCDQLRRAYDGLESPALERNFLFNLPATWQTGVARKMMCSELKRLGDFLARLGGRAPTAQILAHTMQNYGAARTELARAGRWCHGAAYAKAVAQFHREGSVELPPRSQIASDIRYREDQVVRFALVGGPFALADLPLMGVIEAMGGAIVLNATETGERTLAPCHAGGDKGGGMPEGESVDSLMETLARDVQDQCVDVFQRPNTRLYAWLGRHLAERKVQGIILWCYVGCDLWRAEAEGLREVFKLPLLVLEADESGNVSTRNIGKVQAFLESFT